VATYSTDLTTLNTTDTTGTYTEFASPYNGGGSPAHSGEQYIQGIDCVSQNTGKANGLEISCVYDHGTGYTFGTNEVIFMWLFYFAGTNLESYANSGWRLAIGSSTSAWDWFRVGGSDYGSHKYGGWFNFAVDPTATETGTIGGGNGGTYRYFGNVPYTINEVTKGDPVAIDAIRAGRGEISITGSGGTFSELASYNDYNAGGTPPGTSSTSVDSGRHVLGLFQAAGGSYLWKGLMSLGITATSVTFSDSNETIVIDDCPHTYAEFNKVEINNASSSVTLTNITFISTATTTVALGRFEVVDDATVNLIGCSFNEMDTFIFKSNTTCDSTFNSCALVTANSADLSGSTFNNSTSSASVLWNTAVDTTGKLDGCVFSSDGSNHAIEITSFPGSNQITINDATFTGYASANGSTGNEAIYVNIASGTYTIYTSNCTGNIFYRTAGASVTIVADPVTVQVTTQTGTGTAIGSARVFLAAANGTGPFPYQEAVTLNATASTAVTATHTAHGMATGDKIVVYDAADQLANGVFTITVTNVNTYTYTARGTVTLSSDAATVSFVALEGTTNATTGVLSTSRVYPSNQPVTGWARKSSASPFYKQGPIAGTISSTTGLTATAVMIPDE